MELQDFDENEVSELSRYISVKVPNSVLNRIYFLTEKPEEKSLIFITCYRILSSCKDYASNEKLRNKLDNLLEDSREVYEKLYPVVLKYNNLSVDVGKSFLIKSMMDMFFNPDYNYKVNKIIHSLLVFGEKIRLFKEEDYMGIDQENDYGKNAVKELKNFIKKENI